MASVEQQILIRIRNIVSGLPEVRALSNAYKDLNKPIGGIRRTTTDVKDLGVTTKGTAANLSNLYTGFSTLSKNIDSRGIKDFTANLSNARKAITDTRRLLGAGGGNAGLLGAANPILLPPSSKNLITLKPLVDDIDVVKTGLAGATREGNEFTRVIDAINTKVRRRPLSRDFLGTDKFERTEDRAFKGTLEAAIRNSAGAGFLKSPGIGSAAGQAKAVADIAKLEATGLKAGKSLTSSFNGATSAVFRMRAAIALVGAALAGLGLFAVVKAISSFVSEGIRFNKVIESARIGIATLVANTFDLKDAAGNLLSPVESFNAALKESNEIERGLQKAAVETKFEFEDILTFFNSTLVASAGLKATLPQLVTLTQDFALAAGAANINTEKVNTGIKQILTGSTTARNDLARVIFPGLSTKEINEQLKNFRTAGTLVDELEKRLLAFRLSADQVSQSFEAVSSNVEDAFKIFAADANIGLFESIKAVLGFILKQIVDVSGATVQLTPTFQKIANILNVIGTAVGSNLLRLAQDIFGWIERTVDGLGANNKQLSDSVDYLFSIAENLVGIVIDFTSMLFYANGLNIAISEGDKGLRGFAITVALIRDYLNIINGILRIIGATIQATIYAPVIVLEGVVNGINSLLGRTATQVDNITGSVRALFGTGIREFLSGFNLSNTKSASQTFEVLEEGRQRGASLGVNRSTSIAPRPGTRGVGGGSGGADKTRNAQERIRTMQRLAEAINDLQQAFLDRELDLFNDANELILNALERRYDQGLIATEEYYKQKNALDEEALKLEERNLRFKKLSNLAAFRNEAAAILGKKNGGFQNEEFDSLIGQLDAAKGNEFSQTTPMAKVLVEYLKLKKDQVKLDGDIEKIATRRKKTEQETKFAIEDQTRSLRQQLNDLNAEFNSLLGNEGIAEQQGLGKRISDELSKSLTENDGAIAGVKALAEEVRNIGTVSIDGFLNMLDEAGIKTDSLSESTRQLIAILRRIDFLAAQRQTAGDASQILAGLGTTISGAEQDESLGRTSNSAARKTIADAQNEAIAKLNRTLAEYKTRIDAAKAAGVAISPDDVRNAKELEQSIKNISVSPLLNSVDNSVGQAETTLDGTLSDIEAKVALGAITTAQASRQATDARLLLLQTYEAELAYLQTLDISIPAVANKIVEMQDRINGLKTSLNENFTALASNINGQIGGAFSSFVDSIIDGTESIGNAFRKMLSGLLLGIAKAIAQALLLKFVLAPLGLTGGDAGGAGGFLSGLIFGKKAEGGFIAGAGTGVSDSIPTLLSHGEYVLPARSVQSLGLGFLETLRSGSFIPRLRGFAMGGLVGDAAASAGSGGGRGGARIVNLLDPNLVSDFMSSAAGEEIILNVIGKNPGLVQRVVN